MKRTKLFMILMMGMVFISFPSCNGAFEDIYDKPSDSQYGFKDVDIDKNKGSIYVDASSYTRWIYINFHNRTIDSSEINSGRPEPDSWDIALHRYDCKILNGGAMETQFSDLGAFMNSSKLPEGEFVEDVTDSITTDMSGMMNGHIEKVESPVNKVLARWLDVDTSTMPPIYTLSDKVYLVRLKDDTFAAVKLRDFRNEKFEKGFLTIDYIYPVQF